MPASTNRQHLPNIASIHQSPASTKYRQHPPIASMSSKQANPNAEYGMKRTNFLEMQRVMYACISQAHESLKEKAKSHEFKTEFGKTVAKEFVASYGKQVEDFVINFGKLNEHDSRETRHYFVEGSGNTLLSSLELVIKTLDNL